MPWPSKNRPRKGRRKIGSTKFNLDQLNVGRGAFMNALTKSLTDEPETEEAA